ncbi:WbuC family cupin fold metalloprotein [bacterium]|jgi:cupin fold WbuC family metalloprotein|nr:WbuC family cupin fold metalloprotein [bacterium]MDG1892112.1 WbuC family cupin fold metalloprotein [Verrucomicrobiota bacterium]
MTKKIDIHLMEDCLQSANNSPRKRSHFNLHERLDEPVQRLCIAMKEGTYVHPHQHLEDNKWELLVALQGTSLLVIFNQKGSVTDTFVLSPEGPLHAVEIPPKTWHTLIVNESESVVLEIKEGPYTPNSPVCFAPWAPKEGTRDATEYLHRLRNSIGTVSAMQSLGSKK